MSRHDEKPVYLPPMRLVSFDEKVELLTGELLNLSPESQDALKELIRLTWHIEQGIEKRRLLSDVPTGQKSTDGSPGDTRMAGLLMNYQRHLARLAARKRKQRERLIEDLWKARIKYLEYMDKIDGFQDPERVKERLAKKGEKAKKHVSVTS